jgi:hypothetical protein
MAKDQDIENEIDEAKEDLREALHEVHDRVEAQVARIRPDRGIRKHPITSACIAGALGFALGADSGEAATIGLLLLGAAVMLTRIEVEASGEIERV